MSIKSRARDFNIMLPARDTLLRAGRNPVRNGMPRARACKSAQTWGAAFDSLTIKFPAGAQSPARIVYNTSNLLRPFERAGIGMPRCAFIKRDLVAQAWDSWARRAASGDLPSRCFLYIHCPYCRQKCTYCQYDSIELPGQEHLDACLQRLFLEVDLLAPLFPAIRFQGMIFGGGTPSLFPDRQFGQILRKVFSSFRFVDDPLNVCEMHPASATRDKIRIAAAHGVNRISLGVQSMTPHVLSRVNRIPVSQHRLTALVRAAKDLGLAEVNIDLLAPLPAETPASFAQSLDRVAQCGPDSMVLYQCNSPKRTPGQPPAGDPEPVDWPAARSLFLERLPSHGFVPSAQTLDLFSSVACFRGQPRFGPAPRYEFFARNPQSVLGLGTWAKSNIFAHMYYQNVGPPDLLSPHRNRYKGFEKTLHYEAAVALCHSIRDNSPLCRAAFSEMFGNDPLSLFHKELETLRERRLVHINRDVLHWNMKFRNERQFKAFQNLLFGLDV